MPTPLERARAYRLRVKIRKGDTIEAEDAAWLGQYERAADSGDDAGAAFGASASSRTIHVEEKRAAVGTGDAAVVAAHAALAREEGRRIDFLTEAGIKALEAAATQSRQAADLYASMVKDLLARTKTLEEVHLSMLDAVREQYLARTQAEVDALQAQGKDDKDDLANQLLAMILPRLGGVPLPKV